MNKDKQIEEMARDLSKSLSWCEDDCVIVNIEETAMSLYAAGYRKQSEGEWEIVKGSNGQEKMVCTNCRHGQDLHSTFTYCPNCGARMHGAKMKGGE